MKDKLASMREEEQFELLASDSMLVKRAILVTEDTVRIGYREKEWAETL